MSWWFRWCVDEQRFVWAIAIKMDRRHGQLRTVEERTTCRLRLPFQSKSIVTTCRRKKDRDVGNVKVVF